MKHEELAKDDWYYDGIGVVIGYATFRIDEHIKKAPIYKDVRRGERWYGVKIEDLDDEWRHIIFG